MKYWGRCLLLYLTITAVLYGTNSVEGRITSVAEDPERGTYGPYQSGGSMLKERAPFVPLPTPK